MKIGEFCKVIGVSNKSYNNFMRSSGNTGSFGNTYIYAMNYFQHMDAHKKALKKAAPDAKKQKTAAKVALPTNGSTSQHDITTVTLPGEETDSVKVYDTCDEIRRKINVHLKNPGVTQAAFLRDLVSHCLHASKKPASFQGKQLTSFREKHGPRAGCTTNLYYAAYVFFEKERLVSGGAKTKHRQEMEKHWPAGFDLNHDGRRTYLCARNERPWEDEYGQAHFGRR